jgi:hypothetical protein
MLRYIQYHVDEYASARIAERRPLHRLGVSGAVAVKNSIQYLLNLQDVSILGITDPIHPIHRFNKESGMNRVYILLGMREIECDNARYK